MYHIVLVDDEPLIIKSLKSRINWADYDCQVVGEATNGIAAYDLIAQIKPDIVFTDIRMAGISGLELIQKANEAGLSALFIVISGYAEFAYAQKALNQGALGFCLKPFDENEIIQVLKKAIAVLSKNRIRYEEQLLALLEDDKTQKQAAKIQLLNALGFHSEVKQGLVAAVVIGSTAVQPANDHQFLQLKIGSSKYAYIIELSPDDRHIEDCLQGIPEPDDDIGLSEIHYTTDTLEDALEEAGIAANQPFLTGRHGQIYTYTSQCPEGFDIAIREMGAALAAKNQAAAERIIDQIAAILSEGKCTIRQALKAYNVFLYFYTGSASIMQDGTLVSSEQLISQFSSAPALFATLKGYLHENTEHAAVAEETRNTTFKRIVDYVNQNYCQDISLQNLAAQFNVNANYISQLFSRETGQTFTEYLTTQRMNYAERRLLSTDLPVFRIAEETGYKDYFHFAKVFKRATGSTPTDYRKAGMPSTAL
ncbi:MAG: response regulator [Clostridiaceae bacterium]|nr:response regulator [Clostridiaceae bacterium]